VGRMCSRLLGSISEPVRGGHSLGDTDERNLAMQVFFLVIFLFMLLVVAVSGVKALTPQLPNCANRVCLYDGTGFRGDELKSFPLPPDEDSNAPLKINLSNNREANSVFNGTSDVVRLYSGPNSNKPEVCLKSGRGVTNLALFERISAIDRGSGDDCD
jgi:hypothetical protein